MILDDQITQIEHGLEILDLKYDQQQLLALRNYAELLYAENSKLNLTRIPLERFAVDHILDSLAAAKHFILDSSTSLIDLGTGAGLPGIPVKIFWPQLDIVLLDAREKKVAFLKKVIRSLQLTKIEAVHGRAEDLAHASDFRERFDFSVARALAELDVYLEMAVAFVKLGGKVLGLKSQFADQEIDKARPVAAKLGCLPIDTIKYLVPCSDLCRCLVSTVKNSPTESTIPRSTKRLNN